MSNREQVVLNGRYELHRRVGRGGMAEVYLARDRLLDRLVAIKILFPEFATDPSFVARFRREAQAAANLNHPNIVGVYDWGKERGTYYIVMEYVDGQSISDILRADGTIEPMRAAGIAADVAAALGFAHRKGVVHRDVKPGNVLITKAGEVKVADFGIARAMTSSGEENLTQTGSVMGTATYFSPEQAQGKTVDARTDLYSLGVVLYEMASGKPPFSGDSPVAIAYQHVQEPLPPLRERAPGIPADYEAITAKALSKDADDRYPDGAAMRADLLRFREGRPVEAAAVGAPVPTPVRAGPPTSATAAVPRQPTGPTPVPAGRPPAHELPPRRRTGWFFVAILLLLAVLGGLLFAFGRQLGIFDEKVAKVEIPADLVGQNVVIAQGRLEGMGFVVTRRPEPSTTAEPGSVISSDPAGGTKVDEGSKVLLVYVEDKKQILLEDVAGLPAAEARQKLVDLGFTNIGADQLEPIAVDDGTGTGTGTGTEPVEIGDVIRVLPTPGTKIPADTLITLVVATEPTAESTTTVATTIPVTTTAPPVTTTAPPATTTTAPPATTTTAPPATTTTASPPATTTTL